MSVVVLGMEIPKSCESCGIPCELWMRHKVGQRHHDCPIRPLPKGHGRLIDAEALEHIIGKLSISWEYGQGVSDCWDALIDSPTIVEAEEE